jgi:glycerol kinase
MSDINKKCFIVLDQGSSSSRTFAIDTENNILLESKDPISPHTEKGVLSYYDGNDLLKSQLKTFEKVANSVSACEIIGIGVTSQRSTIVMWDSKTGKTLCPVLSWQDARATKEIDACKIPNEKIHKITGLYKTPYFSAPKIKWCIDNYSDVRKALKQNRLMVGPVASYLVWHLSGQKSFCIDVTLAQRTLLFNINTLTWDDSLLKAFGIPKEILPKIKNGFESFGIYTSQNKQRMPILAMLGDQQAALASENLKEQETAVLNYGTGAFFLVNTGSAPKIIPGILSAPARQDSDGSCTYLAEGIVITASLVFDWLKRIIEFDAKKIDEYCRESKNPVMVLPAIGGIGSPYWDYKTSTTMTGLTRHTTTADIVCGALKSIAFLVLSASFEIQRAGAKFKRVLASGGLSKSDYLLQLQADLLQVPVVRQKNKEATAIGMANFMSQNLKMTLDISKDKAIEKIFYPKMPPKAAQSEFGKWTMFYQHCKDMTSTMSKL